MTFTSRHGLDRLVEVFVVNKKRVDKVGRGDNVFPDHSSHDRGFAVTTRASSLGFEKISSEQGRRCL